MKKIKNKINFLSVNNYERSSRFVVDLNNKKTKEIDIQKDRIQDKIKKIAIKIIEIEFGKEILKYYKLVLNFIRINIKILGNSNFKKDKIKNFFLYSASSFDYKNILANKHFLKIKSIYYIKIERFNQIAFFSLFKAIIKLSFKIINLSYSFCYYVGWLIMFVLRFLVLFIFKINIVVINILKSFYLSLSPCIKQIFKFIMWFNAKIKFVFKDIKQNLLKVFKEGKSRINNLYTEENIAEIAFKEDNFEINKYFNNKKATKWQIWRPRLSFFLFLFILVLPFKAFTYYKSLDLDNLNGRVLGATENAVDNFFLGAGSVVDMNFKKANADFLKAGNGFIEAQDELKDINNMIFAIASVIPKDEVKMASLAKNVLEAGESVSLLGSNLSLAFESIFKNKNKDKDLIQIVDDFANYVDIASDEAKILNNVLDKIDFSLLPSKYSNKISNLKIKTINLEKYFFEFSEIIDSVRVFLGESHDKRYLLVFQNNSELRATGGFIGSYALIDFRSGKIKNLEVPKGGGYDTEGGLTTLVTSPEPLWLVNPLWHFWDANWWPDWEKSSKKLMWFYEKSGGSTVDGVISFTPTVIERILKIIGPIDMSEDYGVVINYENFWSITQAIVEEKLTEEQIKIGEKHEPKKIIGDLMNKIIEELPKRLDKQIFIKLLFEVEASLNEKHCLFYFTDSKLQNNIKNFGWDGKIKATEYDYLSVINTNIAGGKSDRKIKEEIDLSSEIMPDSSIVNTLKIKRIHTGAKEDPFSGVRNVNWMRIYVPLGSELLEAKGFDKPNKIYFEDPDIAWEKDKDVYQEELNSKIHEPSGVKIYFENGKTVFANWSMVDPGEEIVIYLKYILPFKFKEKKENKSILNSIKKRFNFTSNPIINYSLLVQKQAGAMPSDININVKLPDNFNVIWQYPRDLEHFSNGWDIKSNLNIDKYWAFLVEKNID